MPERVDYAPETTIPAEFGLQTRISAQQFEELETEFAISLTADQRRAIEEALQEYEIARRLIEPAPRNGEKASRARPDLRKVVTQTIGAIDKLIWLIRNIDSRPGHLWDFIGNSADVDPSQELDRLRRLRCALAGFGETIKRHGRRPDRFLESLLVTLDATFRRAGGKSDAAFVRFSGALLSELPLAAYPERGADADPQGALAARWERIKAERQHESPFRIWAPGPHPFGPRSILARLRLRGRT